MKILVPIALLLTMQCALACKCDEQSLMQREVHAQYIFVGSLTSFVDTQPNPGSLAAHKSSVHKQALVLVSETFRGSLSSGRQVMIDYMAGTSCEAKYIGAGSVLFVVDNESSAPVTLTSCDVYPLNEPNNEPDYLKSLWEKKLAETSGFLQYLRKQNNESR